MRNILFHDGDPSLLIPLPTARLGLENCAPEIAI
jgi:hypothetical protein